MRTCKNFSPRARCTNGNTQPAARQPAQMEGSGLADPTDDEPADQHVDGRLASPEEATAGLSALSAELAAAEQAMQA